MIGARKSEYLHNLVHRDEIWRDHVQKEYLAARRWPEKWGTLYHKANPANPLAHRKSQDHISEEAIKLPAVLQWAHGHAIRKYLYHTTADNNFTAVDYPRTTAREIGWRHKDFPQLEMCNTHAKGYCSFEKQLNWPQEGMP